MRRNLLIALCTGLIAVFAAACACGGGGETSDKGDKASADSPKKDDKKGDDKKGDDKKADAKKDEPAAPKKEAVGEIKIELKLDEAKTKAAADLAKTVTKKGEFSWKDRGKPEKAELYLHLAATSTDDNVRAAALQAMPGAFTSYAKDEKRRQVDADYKAVIGALLESPNDKVVARALTASTPAINSKKPDEKIVASMISLASTHPKDEGRMAALYSLRSMTDHQKDPKVVAAILKNMESDNPLLAATAIDIIFQYGLNEPDKVEAALEKHLTHKDANIRGRAALKYAQIVARKNKKDATAAAVAKLEPMLKDKSAYVRSEVADAFVALRHLPAVHNLVKMLEDKEKNSISTPYTDLAGNKRNFISDGSGWSRVDDAVLWAISNLSRNLKGKDKHFKLRKINYGKVDEDIKEARKEAMAWYEANKAEIK